MPNQVQQVGFFSPGFDYSADLGKIERRRRLAEALQAQSAEPLQTPVTGGWASPIHPLQGAAKLLQAYAGKKVSEKADAEQKALAAKSQSDYKAMLARGLKEMETNPQQAMGTFATHPMGQALIPLAMQKYSQQQLVNALRGQATQGALSNGQGPTVENAQRLEQGTSPGGVPLEAWVAAGQVPGATNYLSQLNRQGEALGGVQYDQSGKAFVTTKGGEVKYLPGITARDKMEMADTGGELVPYNPYQQNQPIKKSLSPSDTKRIPMEEARMRDEGIIPSAPIPPRQQPVQGGAQTFPIGGQRAAPLAEMSPKQERELAAKRAEEQPKAEVNLRQSMATADTVFGKIDEALKQIDWKTTGVVGAVAGRLPGSPAFDLRQTIDTLQGNIGFEALKAMRAASPTGGALGQVAVRELELLQSTIASLNPSQSGEQLKRNLLQVKTHFENWRNAVQQHYEQIYGTPQGVPLEPQKQRPVGGYSIRRLD